MRSTLLRCALAFATIVGLSGCKSGKIGMPKFSNPFARSVSNTSPELPTASTTPTAPKAGFAAATAGTTAPLYTGPSGAATSSDAPGSYAGRSPRSSVGTSPPTGYGATNATASRTSPYTTPQAGRYDTRGGYGSPSSSPSYNAPPPLTASRTGAAPGYGSSPRDYSSAAPSGRYGSSVETTPRYGTNRDRSATPPPGYGADPPRTSSLGSRHGTDTGSRASDAYTSTGSGRYGTPGTTRPWTQDNRKATDPSAVAGSLKKGLSDPRSYLPPDRERRVGDTGYVPGRTGYTPGDTGYKPPNTPGYKMPASPYRSPLATGAGDSGYAPGSTSRWSPSKSPATPTNDTDRGYPATDYGVTPAGFSQPRTTGTR